MSDEMIRKPFLAMEGVHNFRDYGGYSVSGGGRVRSGLLFRSGHHAEATPKDLEKVAQLALAHVIDLRGDKERARHTCVRHESFSAQIHFFEGETAGLAPHLEAAEKSEGAEGARAAMIALYAALPDRDGLNWVLKRYFSALAQGDGASLVHCAAGKDRTGIAVDLLHHILGVHPDDAMEDYLLTNRSPRNEERIAHGMVLVGSSESKRDEASLRVLMGVEPAFLQAARASVKNRFGSTDAYLERVLDVGLEKREALKAQLVDV